MPDPLTPTEAAALLERIPELRKACEELFLTQDAYAAESSRSYDRMPTGAQRAEYDAVCRDRDRADSAYFKAFPPSTVSSLLSLIQWQAEEIERLSESRDYWKRSSDEARGLPPQISAALNEGDGSYRP